jgi:GTP-binding protein
MLEQTRHAVHEADLVFFLIDGRQGITPIESHFARWLRKEDPSAPIHLVANKVEGYPDKWQDSIDECYQLGMGSPIPLSAEHGEGMTNLIDVLMPMIDEHDKAFEVELKAFEAEENANGQKALDTNEDDVSRSIHHPKSVVIEGLNRCLIEFCSLEQ